MPDDPTAAAPDEAPEPLPDAPAAVGDVLVDRWSVSQIHRGGQAWVLVVEDVEGGERRAVKLPPSGALTGDAELASLLRLEPHPHVVTALDVAEIGDRRGLVLEYAPATLADLLRRGSLGTWPLPRPRILQEICDGMAYLSRRGEFAHLDLKPSNVLVDDAGRAKIADFGLSRQILIRDGRFSAAPGGTWAYAAPEVIRGEPCDSRADVFSFGVLLYQLCTGRLPFPFPLAATPAEQRAQLLDYYASPGPKRRNEELYYHGQLEPTQLPAAPPAEGIGDVVSGCLQMDMAERHRSFGDLAKTLAFHLPLPEVHAETVPLAEADRRRRELALSRALIRLGRTDEAIRHLNRLATEEHSAAVMRALREALTAAGRADEAAGIEEWG